MVLRTIGGMALVYINIAERRESPFFAGPDGRLVELIEHCSLFSPILLLLPVAFCCTFLRAMQLYACVSNQQWQAYEKELVSGTCFFDGDLYGDVKQACYNFMDSGVSSNRIGRPEPPVRHCGATSARPAELEASKCPRPWTTSSP